MTDIHNSRYHQVEARLFFGANIPVKREGLLSVVTDNDFARFLADSVTPHFPGFTVVTADGYWKGEPETVRVLSILADDSDAFRQQVRWIAEHYKSDFQQEAVAYAFTEAAYTMEVWPHGPSATYHKAGLGY